MARSTYIYVAMDGGLIARAFTVKHELKTWAEQQAFPDYLRFFRVRDGYGYGRDETTEMTLEEVVKP